LPARLSRRSDGLRTPSVAWPERKMLDAPEREHQSTTTAAG